MNAANSGDDTVIEKAIELGTNFFKNENYQDARKLFEKAVKLVRSYEQPRIIQLRIAANLPITPLNSDGKLYHPRYIKLLDNLAACWEKVGEVSKAIRVSKKMIESEPYNMKGYIRSARLWLKMRDEKMAYIVYKNAILKAKEGRQQRNISYHKDTLTFIYDQRQLLRNKLDADQTKLKENSEYSKNPLKRIVIDPIEEYSELNKKKAKLSILATQQTSTASNNETKSLDFLLLFPSEISVKILKYLPAKDLLSFSTVSRYWNLFITLNSQLFTTLNLNSVRLRQITMFCKFFNKLKLTERDFIEGRRKLVLDSVKLSAKATSEEKKILQTFINYSQWFSIKKLVLSFPNLTTTDFYKYMKENPALFDNVSQLSLLSALRVDRFDEIAYLSLFPKLWKLELLINKAVEPIDAGFSSANSFHLPRNWGKSLESIVMCYKVRKMNNPSLFIEIVKCNLASLRKICLTGIEFQPSETQFDWLESLVTLEELWIENNNNCRLQYFLQYISRKFIFKNLLKLTIRENHIYPPITLATLFNSENPGYPSQNDTMCMKENLKALKHIDFMNTSISGEIVRFINSLLETHLIEYLNIGKCIKLGENALHTQERLVFPNLIEYMLPISHLTFNSDSFVTDTTMRLFGEQAAFLNELQVLDLSHNGYLTGVGVYDFLKAMYNEFQRPFKHLIVNGCPKISHETINSLKGNKFVEKIECNYDLEKWEVFGKNSFNYNF
ncbi:hypothetical protein TBLA_0A09170 [Henningerozyma blattae CBS 6284]|uniref:F-box domain-containing protein n=1 Tax=Henningerozyma blattae (strain ATCC 34711 / CBS 6284 / DSM 70876 / NBRC 10599 / NRRL Y-10934 / UCD 77-7) TaxID=1071380 RepID=I2GX53_HENB6|nr:hypothetical protein TBLA_0A09170 [Tetrapisispora blattae CBS 6284]CCH58705.1 hypothetical protein TBLA_0A09170 [Tetrapisispora blattae CBS 6284]